MRKKSGTLHSFIKQNSLSIALFALFLAFLVGVAFTGYQEQNDTLASHQQPPISFGGYITSGEFAEAVFENWESEFLQMGALVVLTIFLYQRGSADSKKMRGKAEVDTSSRYSIIHATSMKRRVRAVGNFLYGNSLSIALFGLFILSFVLHAVGGTSAYNEEAMLHGQDQVSTLSYIGTSRFWFESFQNWQSEFLAVGALLVLSIFLRQRGSPESKAVGDPDSKTGE